MTETARPPHFPVGIWKLLSFQYEFEDSDQRDEPLGANPVGYLVLTEERLITLMTGRERATDAAAGELLDSMIAYSGRYSLQGDDCFITTVDSAWQPSWIGTEQVRFFKMDGEILSAVRAPRRSEISGTAHPWCGDLAKRLEPTKDRIIKPGQPIAGRVLHFESC